MTIYAIGKKNKKPRMFVDVPYLENAQAQRQGTEVCIEVDAICEGTISSNGKAFTPSGINMVDQLHDIRIHRQGLLSQSDWTIFPDSPMSAEKRQEWMEYRQALRDITDTFPNSLFDDVIWPEPPTS